MSTIVWVLQGILAAVFLSAGVLKLVRSRKQLVAQGASMAWAADFDDGAIKAIGVAEVLAAAGLILPGLLDIATVLTPLAATGLVLLMAGAAATHLRRGETPNAAGNVALGLLAVLVAIARFGPLPL